MSDSLSQFFVCRNYIIIKQETCSFLFFLSLDIYNYKAGNEKFPFFIFFLVADVLDQPGFIFFRGFTVEFSR